MRQLALLHFRNAITLSVKLEDALARAHARVPPAIVQMLLVLQVGTRPGSAEGVSGQAPRRGGARARPWLTGGGRSLGQEGSRSGHSWHTRGPGAGRSPGAWGGTPHAPQGSRQLWWGGFHRGDSWGGAAGAAGSHTPKSWGVSALPETGPAGHCRLGLPASPGPWAGAQPALLAQLTVTGPGRRPQGNRVPREPPACS